MKKLLLVSNIVLMSLVLSLSFVSSSVFAKPEPEPKIDICHYDDGKGEWSDKEIKESDFAEHADHNDGTTYDFKIENADDQAACDELKEGNEKVDVCHYSSSWNIINISLNAFYSAGHDGHNDGVNYDFVIDTEDEIELCGLLVDDPVYGCMDPTANNYDPLATIDNDSCTYDPDPISGCMDPTANNYDPLATIDNDSCTYDPDPISGCMDPEANNYDPLATIDDDSCTYDPGEVLGCMDPEAVNYNSEATIDDDSCIYDTDSVTINFKKIVCDDEDYLPNWGATGVSVDQNTADNFLASGDNAEHCEYVDGWNFQYAGEKVKNSDENDIYEEVSGWTVVGPTDSNGEASTTIDISEITDISVKEVLRKNYIPFTYWANGKSNADDYSAEFYCSKDGKNYDNMEWLQGVEDGDEFYCVAFNYAEEESGGDPNFRGILSGSKFRYDKIEDSYEKSEVPELMNWIINLYDNTWGFLEFDSTNETGDYSFNKLDEGKYYICEEEVDGWEQVRPESDYTATGVSVVSNESPNSETEALNCYEVTIGGELEEVGGLHFGNYEIEYPYGFITNPSQDEIVSGLIDLTAEYYDGDDENDDIVQWGSKTRNL